MTDTEGTPLRRAFLRATSLGYEDRTTYLMELGRRTPWLADEVRRLLAHHGTSNRLDALLSEVRERHDAGLCDPLRPHDLIDTQVGQYRLCRCAGEGASSIVFEAEQRTPNRRLAVKILKAWRLSSETKARFLEEANLLARVRHPGLVHVYEAGFFSRDGVSLPFIAMELVRGQTLLEYIRLHKPSCHDRLAMLINICEAVAALHSIGIVHRDLKPGNMIVEAPERPKIVDLGAAIVRSNVEDAPYARSDVVGTFAYMSPEQRRGQRGAIDGRADVYSLGLILAEVLGPRRRQARQGTESTQALPTARAFALDLAAIVRRATAPDPSCRYDTASAIVDELVRVQRHEPILARSTGAFGRLGRFYRRYQAASIAAGSVCATLVAAFITVTIALVTANEKLTDATRSREQAEQTLSVVLGSIAAVDPRNRPDGVVSFNDFIRSLATFTNADGAQDPLVVASVRHAIGSLGRATGDLELAEANLVEALDTRLGILGSHHRETLRSRIELARVRGWQGDRTASKRALQEVIAEIESAGTPTRHVLVEAIEALGEVCFLARDFEQAAVLFQDAHELRQRVDGARARSTLGVLEWLALTFERLDRFSSAAVLRQQLASDFKASSGPNSPGVRRNLSKFADNLQRTGRYSQAVVVHEDRLRRYRAARKVEWDAGAMAIGEALAECLELSGHVAQADRLYSQLIARARMIAPIQPRRLGDYLIAYAHFLCRHDRHAEARNFFGEGIRDLGAASGAARTRRIPALHALLQLESQLGHEARVIELRALIEAEGAG